MATADLERTRVFKYSRTVGMTTMRGRGFYYPVDSAMARDGRIYVVNRSSERAPADTVRVTMLNMDGEYFGVFGAGGDGEGEFLWPSGIALDGDGRVYVSDEHLHRITVFTASGDFVVSWGTHGSGEGELDSPSGLAFDLDDNILVSDGRNHRVQRFTKNGVFLSAFGGAGSGEGELDMPWGLTTNADGNVFVADWGNDRVQVFDGDGKSVTQLFGDSRLSKWGVDRLSTNPENMLEQRARVKEPAAEKWFVQPTAVTVDDSDRIIVVDSARHRLQIYQKHTT